jgi:tRNA (uracil-5-)-methyltransferase TRM9
MLEPMKRGTVLALNALNQAFYAAIAAEWSETRKHSWPGFERVAALSDERQARRSGPGSSASKSEPLRVLDVGAGDGRFAAFLNERWPDANAAFEYLGLDASAKLLDHARSRRFGSHLRFERWDFIVDERALPSGPFDLVLLFGVLHHVPSFELRAQLVRELAQRTAAGGIFAMTFWRLDRDPRFESRVRSFAQFNASAHLAIDEGDLEPGDTLLAWGSQGSALRYCHFSDASETEALITAAGLPVIARFDADGRGNALNEYVVFAGESVLNTP